MDAPALLDTLFWHSIPNDTFGATMLHNTRLRRGWLPSGGLMRPHLPDGAIASPYSSFTSERPKEDVWEEVRRLSFPGCPSRREALFLFDDETSLQGAQDFWWPNQPRRLLAVRVAAESALHRGDARWLDGREESWRERARDYWGGKRTDLPIIEVVVQGIVFFPDWESFPGLGAGAGDSAKAGTDRTP
jgi:hypothetical protein